MLQEIIALLKTEGDFMARSSAHVQILNLHPAFRDFSGPNWFTDGEFRKTSDCIIVMVFKGELSAEEAAKSLVTLSTLTAPVPWETEYWLTNGGNVLCCNRHGESWFSKPNGEFIRQIMNDEANYLVSVCPKISGLDIATPEIPLWHFLTSIPNVSDFSRYKAETCSNGGDYAFYTYEDWYIGKANGRWLLRSVTRHSTSAEFDYDELSGSFQHTSRATVANCDVVYQTQGGGDLTLEQISQIRPFNDLWKSEHVTYTERDCDEDKVINLAPFSFKPVVRKIVEITGCSGSVKSLFPKTRKAGKGSRR